VKGVAVFVKFYIMLDSVIAALTAGMDNIPAATPDPPDDSPPSIEPRVEAIEHHVVSLTEIVTELANSVGTQQEARRYLSPIPKPWKLRGTPGLRRNAYGTAQNTHFGRVQDGRSPLRFRQVPGPCKRDGGRFNGRMPIE
jgi:hypothetical protein